MLQFERNNMLHIKVSMSYSVCFNHTKKQKGSKMARNKMITCKHCGEEIAASAKVCPKCGGKNKKSLFKRPWFYILIALVLFIVVCSSGMRSASNMGKTGTVDTNTANTQNNVTKTDTTLASSTTTKEAPTPKPTEAPVKTEYSVGDILQDGNLKIIYAASGVYHEDNQFLQPNEGNQYIFLRLAFINEGTSDRSISTFDFNAFADGYACDAYYNGGETLSATLSAGRSTMGEVYFQIPIEAKDVEIEYETNYFTQKKIHFLYEGEQDSGYVLESNMSRSSGAYSVGDTISGSGITIQYISCEPYQSNNQFVQPKDGYHYVSLILEFENTGSSDKIISAYSFDCYADGAACEQTYIRDDSLSATLSPGRKVKGTVTFEVPDQAEVIEAEYEDNIWTSGKIILTVK